ncbi:MAG TPA: hypothetical protein VLJ41_00145, partial [Segetibacter sp.]|nr:hypothetical protein [Segetibacter sp.]
MKLFLSTVFSVVILCSSLVSFSQNSNLEFVENKGQWENEVKFKGVLNNGAFFLQEKGFSVVQHKAEDLEYLQQSNHATVNYTKRVSAKTAVSSPDDKLIIHSHSYNVKFVNASTPVISGDKPLATY